MLSAYSLISVLLLSVLVSTPGNAQASNSESRFGSNGGVETFPKELNKAGIGISREWILWAEIEPAKGLFDWSAMDEKVRVANRSGIEILGYFANMPAWAKKDKSAYKFFPDADPVLPSKKKGKKDAVPPTDRRKVSDFSEPEDINDFRRFARIVAERYDGRHGHGLMRYIEILNEVTYPDFFDFKHTPYEPWLINGFQGVKEGNPQAKVLIGGFVNPLDVREFVDRMLKDYHRYYDIVNFHIYSQVDAAIIKSTQYLKKRMEAFGVNKPIWITETGTLAGLNDKDWKNRVAIGVVKRYVMAFGEGVEKVFWWPLLGHPSPDEYPGAVVVKNGKLLPMALAWGIKGKHDFHPRPAYTALSIMTSKLRGFNAVKRISDGQYEFMVNGKSIYVSWCETGRCLIPPGITGRVKVTNYLGKEEVKLSSEITLTQDPFFIEKIDN